MNPLLLFLFVAAGCQSDSPPPPTSYHLILGRGSPSSAREPVYRAAVPPTWIEINSHQSAEDTREPIAEWRIDDPAGAIRVVIHNFPSEDISSRIPPQAQLARWEGQFEAFEGLPPTTKMQAYGGYAGFAYEASGRINGQPSMVLGWAMSLDGEHYRNLSYTSPAVRSQLRADYTIKATGPKGAVEKHKKALEKFARSFEPINPLPS